MCGIFGAINFTGFFTRGAYEEFVRLTDLVSYRGPDASDYRAFRVEGRETQVTPGDKFNLFLGHRRLSIIDLSDAGIQPFTDDGELWITFNGEIFNYVELRE